MKVSDKAICRTALATLGSTQWVYSLKGNMAQHICMAKTYKFYGLTSFITIFVMNITLFSILCPGNLDH